MVDLEGYLILVVQTVDGKIRLFGSPADHSDLEVGDEIVEVNGETLEGATHAEVISHIHTCIKSRTIQLRVKRSCAEENIVPGLNEIQDAYVIAVEEQARQRLEQLSVLHKVRPVDISSVGTNNFATVGANGHSTSTTNAHGPPSSNKHGPTTYVAQAVHQTAPPHTGSGSSGNSRPHVFIPEVGKSSRSAAAGSVESVDSHYSGVSGSEESLSVGAGGSTGEGRGYSSSHGAPPDVIDTVGSVTNGYVRRSSGGVAVHGGGVGGSNSDIEAAAGSSTSLSMPQEAPEARYPINGALKESNWMASPSGAVPGQARKPNMASSSPAHYGAYDHHGRSKENLYDSETELSEMALNESGPHREMAIDVPSGFVGKAKEPPRFPSQNSGGRGSGTSTPVKQNKNSRNWEENITPYEVPAAPTAREREAAEERVRHYQEELRKQREEKNRIAREEEFLRTSLRGSKKLQALEESRQAAAEQARTPPSGIVNPNFITEEDVDGYDGSSRASTLALGTRTQQVPFKPTGVEDLFSSLQHIQSRLEAVEDQKDVHFLSQLFHNSRFQEALNIHNKVIEVTLRSGQATPVIDNAHQTAADVLAALAPRSGDPAVDELHALLHKADIKGLLYTHDKVAGQKAAVPKASSTTVVDNDERDYLYERASQYGEESIKIVRLQKTADPLGATVRNEGESVIIGRIVKGGAAEKSGLLHEGDEVLEINGVDMRGRSVNDVCDLMANMTGTLTFLIVPRRTVEEYSNGTAGRDKVTHMRAHFNYDPEDDLYIPCRELGISFLKGDILHVINQEDQHWWQAYREGEEDQALAGLIPSRSFQQTREAMRQTLTNDGKESGSKKKHRCRCAKTSKKKKKKQLYSGTGEEAEAEEILTYEDVSLYYPQPNRKRPIVLIGPQNIGIQELRKKVMESDDERFAAAIPHTSRPRKPDENDGVDFHFVPRHTFEGDIVAQRFVEYGEYESNLYGTSLDAIRQVITQGRICLLNLYPQSLRILKGSDLKPYVVFIAPPNLEKLKQMRNKEGTKITDAELKDIIEKAREMEDTYGHYFDMIISMSEKSYEEVLAEINRLEVEPQWVPSHWVT